MKATIAIKPTPLLRDVKHGDLFVVHTIGLEHCVCMWAQIHPRVGKVDGSRRLVFVIANEGRLDGYAAGAMCSITEWTPITFVEAVEPVAFRERTTPDDVERYLADVERALNGARIPLADNITFTGAETPPDDPLSRL